jgi:hypothetical protein
MRNKKLQDILKQYPDNMEVVLLGGYGSLVPSMEVEKITVTTYPEDIDEENDSMKSFYNVDSDDYWSFRRVKVDILQIR